MYSFNRIGQNRPLCNNRQFCTMGIVKNLPEEMILKPEYLGNDHLKFLNNFGLQQQFISDKKFEDIHNCVNRHSNRVITNPSCTMPKDVQNFVISHQGCNYNGYTHPVVGNTKEYSNSKGTDKKEDINKVNMETEKQNQPAKTCDESKICPTSNIKIPKKTKRNCKTQCDKLNQKSSPKKYKKQKNYQKQSKRESDRNIIRNSMSPRKYKNGKSWHKQSFQMEIDIDDSYSDQILESPSFCTIKLSSPMKSKVQNDIHNSSTNSCKREQQPHVLMGNSANQNNFRPRLPSECESEDSFIVFEECSRSFDLDDSEESTDSDSSLDDDSDDGDVMDCGSAQENLANWRIEVTSPCKKVRFAVGKDLCEVHPMVQWSFAYQKARKGPWEQFAVDRMRFKKRVSDIEPILNAVFLPAHRSKIYKERFL